MSAKNTVTNATLISDWQRTAPPRDFPLGIHKPTAQFCKKIKGAVRYFGKLPDWRNALSLYEREKDVWESGRNPREVVTQVISPSGATSLLRNGQNNSSLYAIAAMFIHRENERRQRINPTTGKKEITDDSFLKSRRAVERAVRFFGDTRPALSILPDEWAKFRHALYVDFKLGPAAVQHHIIYIRSLSTWAHETAKLIGEPFHFGDGLQYVPKSELRIVRRRKARENGEKVWPIDQVPYILEHVKDNAQVYAAVLLALNGAFNATDVSELTDEMIDWREGFIDFDRGKTGIRRFIYLWPETLDALKRARLTRPAPIDAQHTSRVFMTKRGVPWVRRKLKMGIDEMPAKEGHTDSLSQEFIKVLNALDELNPDRVGGMKFKRGDVSFSAGRHTAQSVLSSLTDRETRLWISGHAHAGMDDHYLHVLEDTKSAIAKAVEGSRQILLLGNIVSGGSVIIRNRGPRLLAGPVGMANGTIVGESAA